MHWLNPAKQYAVCADGIYESMYTGEPVEVTLGSPPRYGISHRNGGGGWKADVPKSLDRMGAIVSIHNCDYCSTIVKFAGFSLDGSIELEGSRYYLECNG